MFIILFIVNQWDELSSNHLITNNIYKKIKNINISVYNVNLKLVINKDAI